MPVTTSLLEIATGFTIGILIGITGIGGGSLMTPALIYGFGLPPSTAVGTDLLYASLTKINGALSYVRQQLVHWRSVACLLGGSVPASILSIRLLPEVAQHTEQLIALILGVALLLTSLSIFAHRRLARTALRLRLHRRETLVAVLQVLAGLILGTLVTLSSVGAGVLGTAIIVLLRPRMMMASVVGTDLVHAVSLSLVAASGHLALNHVDWQLLLVLLIGSLPGVWIGARTAPRFPERILRRCMALLLGGIGGGMLAIQLL